MAKERIYDDIRSRLNQYPTELDEEQFLKKVRTKRASEKRPRMAIFFLPLVGLTVSTVVVFNSIFHLTEPKGTTNSQGTETKYEVDMSKQRSNVVQMINGEILYKKEDSDASQELHEVKNSFTENIKEIQFGKEKISLISKATISNSKIKVAMDDEGNSALQSSIKEASTLRQLNTIRPIVSNNKLGPNISIINRKSFQLKEEKSTLNKFSITWLSGYDLANKKLSGIDRSYEQEREETETNLPSFSTEIQISCPLNNGVKLISGLSYQQINEKLLWERLDTGILIRRDGQFYKQELQRVKTHYNRMEFWEVPILIGYDYSFGKWELGVNGGVYLNIHSSFSGEIRSSDLQSDTFISLADYSIHRGLGINPAFRLRLGYQIEDWRVLLEPGFKIQGRSIIEPNMDFEQKYSFWSLRLGLTKEFGRSR